MVSPSIAKRHRVSDPKVYPAALLTSFQLEEDDSYKAAAVPAISLVELSSFLKTDAPLQATASSGSAVFCALGAPLIPFKEGTIPEQVVITPGVKLGRSGAYPRSFIIQESK